MTSIISNVDSYKHSHYKQYPPGTKYISSYIEARKDRYPVTFFGLQMFLEKYLMEPFTLKDINVAEMDALAHGEPFNREGWTYILQRYNGYLPLRIQAVKEGAVLPAGNVLVQIANTDPEVPWLVSYIETALLRGIWYPTTVASRSRYIKTLIKAAIDYTSDDPTQLLFKLHDFGARGVSSLESSKIGGTAHLVNFMGTDTFAALAHARKYYGEQMAGNSIPAAEHATITSWGRGKEAVAYKNMFVQFPTGLMAVVSDSYDLDNAVVNIWGRALADDVRNRSGVTIIRPDSGDPVMTPVNTIMNLMDKFGYETNSKGFNVLPLYVRVIQGDGVNEDSITEILALMIKYKLAIDNLAFGMGGELLQTVNRDTMSFAMKASAIKTDGYGWEGFNKAPVNMPEKASKIGRLGLIKENGVYKTVSETESNGKNLLETVYDTGLMKRYQTLKEIRTLAEVV